MKNGRTLNNRLTIYRIKRKGKISQLAGTKATGLYHLILHLKRPERLRVGRLGLQEFPAGYYLYTGSARRGLASRLQRHLCKEKTSHWHIDRLTRMSRHRSNLGGPFRNPYGM